jgi:hypothetical protein
VLERLYVQWLSRCGIPFAEVERDIYIYIKLVLIMLSLLHYLNPEIDAWLLSSHNTIQEWTIRTYKRHKQVIQDSLQSALSKIHLTVDLWTSPNTLAVIRVVSHYISDSGQLEHAVLALREIDGEHLGENQSTCIMKVV